MNSGHHRRRRLEGQTLFLSASVPSPKRAEQYRRVPDSYVQVEEAVISLARSVFFEGGRLVFGGHPSISPLVAMVASEYLLPRAAEGGAQRLGRDGDERREEAPVIIYQSRAYERFLPDETWLMHNLGYAEIRWTEAQGGERFDSQRLGLPQCLESLQHMRMRLIKETAPVAMVCIGGMEGVQDEMNMFRGLRLGAPIYVIERTGGAAANIAEEFGGQGVVRIPDRELLEYIAMRRRDMPRAEEINAESEPSYTPYPLIMQTIVEDLSGR